MTEALPTVPAVCIYADAEGSSHLIDVRLPALAQVLDEHGKTKFIGSTGATVMGFVVGGGGSKTKEWHTAGMAGLSIVLSGEWEIEAGSGDRRLLRTGSVLLMLDTHGQGHRSYSPHDTGSTVLGVGIDAATRESYEAIVERARAHIGEGAAEPA